MHRELEPKSATRMLICFRKAEPLAGILASHLGNKGIFLLGGVASPGLGTGAFHLLHWNIVEWLVEQHATWYDLNGIDPLHNAGTYFFKKGLAPFTGLEVCYLGEFDTSQGLWAGVASPTAVRAALWARTIRGRLCALIRDRFRRLSATTNSPESSAGSLSRGSSASRADPQT